MNNNRGNNRRRGRGNNRQQGGSQGNRIDSRARGNAPQLLEKYRKLAHDASLNGDRVQAEYYLQFADHYFRVLADSRTVRDDQQPRPRQQGDREQSSDDDFRDEDEQFQRGPRDNGRDGGRDNGRDGSRDNGRAHDRENGRGNDRDAGQRDQADGDERDDADSDGGDEFEPTENPFTRDSRSRRPESDRPRRRPREEAVSDEPAESEGPKDDEGPRFDPASLPPAFNAADAEEKPRRKPRKPRAARDDQGGEELETVS